jgi:hypothetical protein
MLQTEGRIHTHTHSERVILIAFPLQKLLQDSAPVLRYTYIACVPLKTVESIAVRHYAGICYDNISKWVS